MNEQYSITITIPSFQTPEIVLKNCLISACSQSLKNLEIIVIDDNNERNFHKSCKKIVKSFMKDKNNYHANDIHYVCCGENRGLFEARKLGVEVANGEYIYSLDSDDCIPDNSVCEKLLEIAHSAKKNEYCDGNFDVVQFAAALKSNENYTENLHPENFTIVEHPACETKYGTQNEIAEYIWQSNIFCGFVWSKLIKKSIYIKALENKPSMFCYMTEDLVLSYYLYRVVTSYIAIPLIGYQYTLGSGITTKKVDSIEKWKLLCSCSGVFTSILYDIKIKPFPDNSQIPKILKNIAKGYLINNLKKYHNLPEYLKPEAYQILLEEWGDDLVKSAEKFIEKNKPIK